MAKSPPVSPKGSAVWSRLDLHVAKCLEITVLGNIHHMNQWHAEFPKRSSRFEKRLRWHCQRITVHRLNSFTNFFLFLMKYFLGYLVLLLFDNCRNKGFNRSLWLFTNAAHSDIYSLPVSTDCRSTLLVFFFLFLV